MQREEKAFWILVILVMLCTAMAIGCSPSTPAIKTPPYEHNEVIFAYEIYKASRSSPTPAPDITPTPAKPKVGDKCPICDGKGAIDGDKDGKPDYGCSDCRGDGRVDTGDPILSGGTTGTLSLVVPPLTRAEFEEIASELKNFGLSFSAWIDDGKKQVERFDSGISELFDRTAKLDEAVNKIQSSVGQIQKSQELLLSSQEKKPPVAKSAPTPKQSAGRWETRTRRVCKNGRCYTETYRIWIPTNPQSSNSSYPLRPQSTWWTGCSSWVHLTQGVHRGKFDPAYLQSLSWAELQSLHSDSHEGKVNWQYAR